ncbi:MAG: hypothetical protein WKG06_35015 [Segetibacter sp.]
MIQNFTTEQNEALLNKPERKYTYPQKVWITGGIFALIVVIILLLKATFNVFLLILAGTLIAVFFRGLSAMSFS